MDEKLAKMLEDRLAAAAPPPIERARDFLRHYVHDSDRELLELDIRGMLKVNPTVIIDAVEAIEAVLGLEHPSGTLYQLAAFDGNRMLEDESDAGAAAFLQSLCGDLRRWLGNLAP
jgi:hypothetical protein